MMESASLICAHDYLTRKILQLKINKEILPCFHVQLMDVECVANLILKKKEKMFVLISILVYFAIPRC